MSTECCEPVREVEVQGNLATLQNTVAELEQVISTLVDRLHPVLREPYPSPLETAEKETEKPLVPIAYSIKQTNDRAVQVIRASRDAIDRLEI